MTERRQRFRHGALASLASHVVAILGQLALVPLHLYAWGEQLYGEWLILWAAVAYVGVADLGFSSYVANRLNAQRARGDDAGYLQTLHSALGFSVRISAVAFALLAGAALVLPFDRWLAFEETERQVAVIACLLLALQLTAAIPRGLVVGLYRTIGEYPRGQLLAVVQRLGLTLLTAAGLLLGAGMVEIAALQLVPLLATTVWAWSDLRRRHSWIEIGVQRRVRGLALTFLKPSLLFVAIQVGMVIVLQGSTLVIGALFGAGSVAIFATTRTLANLVRQVTGSLSNALWPEVTALEARGEQATLRRVHRLSVKGLTAFALIAAGVLFLTGRDVFELWTRNELAYSAEITQALLLLLVLQTPWTTSSYVLIATNRHADLARRMVASGLLGLALGAWLASLLGPAGLVVGLIVADLLLCAVAIPRAVVHQVGDRWGSFVMDIYGRGLAVSMLYVACLAAFQSPFDGDPFARTVVGASFAVAAGTMLCGTLWFTSDERAHILGLVGWSRGLARSAGGEA